MCVGMLMCECMREGEYVYERVVVCGYVSVDEYPSNRETQ